MWDECGTVCVRLGSECVLCVGQFCVGFRGVSECCVWECLLWIWGIECVLFVGVFGVGLGE